ncbi:uncharacterized protein LOC143208480 [Lasioglossum baleicum]|uniref:uncharacterized protein LOC143208480 n=1 Tax=Lasioglossum baleicum TaxID=434251 RepID=UPI003FCE99AC
MFARRRRTSNTSESTSEVLIRYTSQMPQVLIVTNRLRYTSSFNCIHSCALFGKGHSYLQITTIRSNLLFCINECSCAARQRLLVALSTLAAIGFLIWPRYATPELIKFEPLDNISTIISTQTNLLTVETTTVRRNFGSSLDQRSSSTYCQTDCKTVSCSAIPKTLDAGNVISEHMGTVFEKENTRLISAHGAVEFSTNKHSPQALCKTANSVKLSLINCGFLGDSLRKNWLSTSLPIEELKLESCSLDEIEDDAFGQATFKRTKVLTLVKNNLSSLRKAVFDPLTSLEMLTIRDNFIKQAEFNLLMNAAGSLSTLDLNGVIDNPQFLQNITGGSALNKLAVLSLQENVISEITDESFKGAPNVVSLFLINSGIVSLSQNSLEPLSSSILQLHITKNRISSLPKGIFDSILHGRSVSLELGNNPWNCDCSLQWMQDLITTHPGVISVPTCSSPSKNAGKPFSTAEFCTANSTAPPITESTTHHSTEQTTTETTTTTTKEPEMITVNCSISEFFASGSLRKLLSSDLEFPSRVRGFFVDSVTDKSIAVKLPSLEKGHTLLWFDSVKRSVNCAKHVTRIYHVQNIDPETTYTICLLSDNKTAVSPLNCLAATTSPVYMLRTWLKNRDKAQAIILLILVAAAALFIGTFTTFLIVWKYPSLLRGSKRVMLVKKNMVDVIVLPKGVNVMENRRRGGGVAQVNNKAEDEYITPLPPAPVPPRRVSRISRVSLLSDWHSYVSEPSETLLASWGLTRLNSNLDNQIADAPPLPPHPLNDIPSLSSTVEARAEDAEYGMFAV